MYNSLPLVQSALRPNKGVLVATNFGETHY